MEMLGSIARVDTGGATARRPGGVAVPATSQAGSSGERRGQRGGGGTTTTTTTTTTPTTTTIAKQAADNAASQAKPAAPPREAPEPPAVQIDSVFEKRLSNGRNGLTIDLVYKNTGLRVARLV